MIEIIGLSKCYGETIVLNNINLTFPQTGLIALVGDSGSGKTTLLNAIAGLDKKITGEIRINSVDITKLSPEETEKFRLNNIGYVFQNFNLINLEKANDNVKLILDAISTSSSNFKKRKIRNVFRVVGITKLLNSKVNEMSGGEKQRVAIARALINNPKLILCDEPTGSLDEKNSQQIMNILKKISSKSLVIIVSHDIDLVKNFADEMIQIKDGNVESIKIKSKAPSNELILAGNGKKLVNSKMSLSFKIKHSINKMKAKKFRNLFTNLMLSLSLTGIGVSFLLTNAVKNKISEAFASLTNGNQIVMSMKNDQINLYSGVYSAPETVVSKIKEKYEEEIEGIGISYQANFEDFFKTKNIVSIITGYKKINLPGFSARYFNEYKWLTDDFLVFPDTPSLKDDDLILGLNFEQMSNLCYWLNIQRSYASLGEFIKKSSMQLALSIANDEWQYDDEQIFTIGGFVQTNQPTIFHSNQQWNKFIFEDHMRFPTNDGSLSYFPWELEKIYYIIPKHKPEDFQNKIMFDSEFHEVVLQRTNYQYNPTLCLQNRICEDNRLYIYYADKNCLSIKDLVSIQYLYPNLEHYFLTSSYGYSSYASNLMSGFSKNFYVSLEKDLIDQAIDLDTSLAEKTNLEIELPDGISFGNYLNGINGGLKFSTKMDYLQNGRVPKNNNEIVVSSGLAKKLTNDDILGKTLHIASQISEEISEDNLIHKKYATTSVTVVGVVNEEKEYIYHNNEWTITFFRDKLRIDSFSLIPNGVVFELSNDENPNKYCDELSNKYHSYSFTNPQQLLGGSLNSTLDYSRAILSSFSIIALVISMLLLSTVVLLNICESKEEILMLKHLGISQKNVNSIFIVQAIIQGLLAFAVSLIELILVENILSLIIGKMMNLATFKFSVSILPILITFCCATLLPWIVSTITIRILSKRKSVD